MARFQFPGKPGKFSVRKRRVLASKLRDKGGKMGGAEITGRFIADFYAMVGDSDEEEVCLVAILLLLTNCVMLLLFILQNLNIALILSNLFVFVSFVFSREVLLASL